MTTQAKLKILLTQRAKAYLTDESEVKAQEVSQAVDEALELGGQKSATTVLTDIAYFRWLMIVNPDAALTDENQQFYKHALSQVRDSNTVTYKTDSRVKQSSNVYI